MPTTNDPTQEYDPTAELANAISDSDTSNDELSRILRERFSTEQGDTGTEGEGESSAETTPPPASETVEPPATTTPPEIVDFGNGLIIDRETARQYAEFAQFLSDNPEFAEVSKRAFEEIAAAASSPPEAPALLTPPEELDLDDPTVKFLWERIQQSDSQLKAALEQIQSHEASISTQTSATTESLVNRAVTSFQAQHNLDDDSMRVIRETASRLQILPSLMAPLDPVTGLPRRVDPLAAIEQSLDTAMWAIPAFRERELTRQADLKAVSDKRKRDLSKLGGSSGSVPRTTSVPNTPEARKVAMIAELSEAMFGPGQSNEEN